MQRNTKMLVCQNCGFKNDPNATICADCQSILILPVIPESPPPAQQVEPARPYPSSQKRRRLRFPSGRSGYRPSSRIILLIAGLLVLLILASLLPRLIHKPPAGQPTVAGSTSPVPACTTPDCLDAVIIKDELLGISDGRYTFDTKRPDGQYKSAAAASLRAGNIGQALAEWNSAHELETNDAEPLIYMENQRVLASGNPYVTLVIGLNLGERVYDGFSHDFLQAAYVEQKEWNANPAAAGGKKLRLLIARSGSDAVNSTYIAKEIVQAAKYDKTIVGVQGWTSSVTTLNVVKVLADAHIPMIAAPNASDALTGISPYFFRVSPAVKTQTPLLTSYVEQRLHAQRLVILKDPAEPYSSSLADDFVHQYTADNHQVAHVENFTTAENKQILTRSVQDLLAQYNPDVIMIATNTIGDVANLLNAIPSSAQYANVKVFTGITGYELVEAGQGINGYSRMLFASPAFPDDWIALGKNQPAPPFFADFAADFDPYQQHPGTYTYSRANAFAMLSYDAMQAFMQGSLIASRAKQDYSPEDMRNALAQLQGNQAFQGVTGMISFGPDGDPVGKANFMLRVDQSNHLHIVAYQGCFLVTTDCSNTVNIIE